VTGRPIYAIKISTSPNGVHDKPAVLILSAHHSREIVTPEIALTAIEQITTGYAQKIPMFTKFVEDYDIWIVPVLNVDGLEYVWTKNNMWRKK
jgi:murein tripeptide amidase MpaA